MQAAADAIGSSRRLLYLWTQRSEQHATENRGTNSPFWITVNGEPDYFHEFVARARYIPTPAPNPDFMEGVDDESERYLKDEAGNILMLPPPDEQPESFSDIEQMRETAAMLTSRAERPQPQGAPVKIFRASPEPGDPKENVTGRPEVLPVAEVERRHPRRSDHLEPPLHPPQRARYARPPANMSLDRGAVSDPSTDLPDTMRADGVPRYEVPWFDRIHTGHLAVRNAKGEPIKY